METARSENFIRCFHLSVQRVRVEPCGLWWCCRRWRRCSQRTPRPAFWPPGSWHRQSQTNWRLEISVADLDPGSAFFTPGSEIRDEQPGSYFPELRNHFLGLKDLNSLMRIRDGKNSDPGWKKSDPTSGLNIPYPQHCLKLQKNPGNFTCGPLDNGHVLRLWISGTGIFMTVSGWCKFFL